MIMEWLVITVVLLLGTTIMVSGIIERLFPNLLILGMF